MCRPSSRRRWPSVAQSTPLSTAAITRSPRPCDEKEAMRTGWGKRLLAYGAALVVAAGLAATPSVAHGELQDPRQDFLRDSQAGLFLHWGMRTAPAHTDCGAWESRCHRRRLDGRLLGQRGQEAARPVHRAGHVPQPAGLRAAVAVEDPRQLPHQARLPRRADRRRRRPGHADHPLHDRRSAVARRRPATSGSTRPASRRTRAQRQPHHPRRLRRVQLRQLLRGHGQVPRPRRVLDRQRQRLLGVSHDLYEQITSKRPDYSAEQQQRRHADHGHGQQRAEDRHDARLRLPAGDVHARCRG